MTAISVLLIHKRKQIAVSRVATLIDSYFGHRMGKLAVTVNNITNICVFLNGDLRVHFGGKGLIRF